MTEQELEAEISGNRQAILLVGAQRCMNTRMFIGAAVDAIALAASVAGSNDQTARLLRDTADLLERDECWPREKLQ